MTNTYVDKLRTALALQALITDRKAVARGIAIAAAFLISAVVLWPVLYARYAPVSAPSKLLRARQTITASARLAPFFRELLARTGQRDDCEKQWQQQAPKDPWGNKPRVKILSENPFAYKVYTMTPWPEINVIEYDSRTPEKGIYSYRF